MDEETKSLLEENLAIGKDNRRMLKKLLSYRRLEAIYSVLKWVVVLGIGLWTYYYLQPYLDQVLAAYNQLNGVFQNLPIPGR
ncbi:MAG: hypothetical protein A2571_01860 [Candidatus Vogelbacteria bacterium RIFOXYD1_FULL_44_32]|uniref:Uncharacterized protein n=1 Tax=Candidatus Vogelbacteria bacterium RIFOXYD1_FULL_44_32 TaxID=1802438 RepID=A0A1G2QEU5_9BACT|nr:MAG: hypothetical protein A2571_01860 [Candidatus Vogelbacteria bacterium RIFOXYD1_FULL_44_32]